MGNRVGSEFYILQKVILESLNRIANIHGRYSVDSKINLNFPKTFTRRLHQIVVVKVQ